MSTKTSEPTITNQQAGASAAAVDISHIRELFPVLQQEVNGQPLVYFDNAATTQKPKAVLDALNGYYTTMNANIHRGVHTLADRATAAFEVALFRCLFVLSFFVSFCGSCCFVFSVER